MSQQPIYDALASAAALSKSVGQMEGRLEMKQQVLAVLRRAELAAPELAAVITEVEQLDIRESDKNGTA